MPDFKQKAEFENVTAIKKTDKALLREIDGKQHWIPASQIDDDSEVFDDTSNSQGKLVVSEYIAVQKGLV